MKDITATDAARHFSDLLDAVEHRRESFTVTRAGRIVARITPAEGAPGRVVKDVLARHRADRAFADDVAAARALLLPGEEGDWSA